MSVGFNFLSASLVFFSYSKNADYLSQLGPRTFNLKASLPRRISINYLMYWRSPGISTLRDSSSNEMSLSEFYSLNESADSISWGVSCLPKALFSLNISASSLFFFSSCFSFKFSSTLFLSFRRCGLLVIDFLLLDLREDSFLSVDFLRPPKMTWPEIFRFGLTIVADFKLRFCLFCPSLA